MTLLAREQAMQRICFDAEPSERDLALLGAPDRWRIYRSMVRGRLEKVVLAALKRSSRALGDALDPYVDRWLAEKPPSTRYFREIPAEFVAFAEPLWRTNPAIPAWLPELARYEIATWTVKHLDAVSREVVPIAFERVLVLDPTVRLLRLEHPVHDRSRDEGFPPEPTFLCIYRRKTDHEAVTYKLNAVAADLVESWLAGGRSLTESVKVVAAKRGTTIDAKFLEGLSTLLADLLERGVVLGSAT